VIDAGRDEERVRQDIRNAVEEFLLRRGEMPSGAR